MKNILRLFVFAFIFMMLFSSNVWGINRIDNPDLTHSLNKQPTRISLLAKYVINRGYSEQQEFVILTLSAMLEAYSQVLKHSSQSQPRTEAGRKKQVTWGWATSKMIASLNHQLRRLEDGAHFNLQVDHLHRILITIDGQLVVFSGPRFKSQSKFEQQIVEYFCLTRDCSWLEPKEPEKSVEEITVDRSLSRGTWLFQHNGKPTYVIGETIYYEFSDYIERDNKSKLCRKITDEIKQLILLMKNIKNNEHTISWSYLVQSQPDSGNPKLEVISGNSETKLYLSLLSHLDQSDWKRLINWLKEDGLKTGKILKIRYLNRLIHAKPNLYQTG